MKIQEIKFKGLPHSYSILIGNKTLSLLSSKIKDLCPKAKKVALLIDSKVPNEFKKFLKKKLNKYELVVLNFNASEKSKSIKTVNSFLEKLLHLNFNRADLIVGVGGGITGDVAGFTSSIYKRGINYINIPTTLLAQVDASIGGKTGVNSNYGKNLIGSFYQPRLVIIDTSVLNSLSKRDFICGYAEILKHAIIKDKNFFNWLKKNSKNIFSKKKQYLKYAIKKSCLIKMFFVNQDVNEKNQRMILNFGHTFAHALEIKNKLSKNISHGEAVLTGMILEARLSVLKGLCSYKTLSEIVNIYKENNLSYTFKKFSDSKSINELLPFLKNDKKNDDKKINFILLKAIGKTAQPNKNKINLIDLKKLSNLLINRNF
tara:strand:- start:701 stop:1819 length:1119 start_codon:yes stop_codon:yes gene_type:complete